MGIVESAADQLDEHVLEARLGLAERDDPRAEAAEGRDHAAERAVLDEDEVDRDRLGRCAVRRVRIARRDSAHDTRQASEDGRAAVEAVELEPEERLALDAVLELGGRAGGEEDGPAGHRLLPCRYELADRPGRGDIEAERRLVEEEDPRVVEESPGEV